VHSLFPVGFPNNPVLQIVTHKFKEPVASPNFDGNAEHVATQSPVPVLLSA